MNTLLEQIKKKNAKAFTHSGKFHADDVFSYALLLYLNPAITITRGIKFQKILMESFLILAGENTTITSATAVSVKMVFLMLHLVFYGKNLVQKFLAKNLPQSSMSHLSSHLILTTIPARKMNLPL